MARKKEQPAGAAPRSMNILSLLENRYIHLAVFTLLTTVLFAQFLFSDAMLSSSDQITGIDSRVVLRDALVKHGQFPTWMPSRLGGMPSIDAMFGDAMYVPSLVMYTLFPIHRAMGLIMVVHVFLAGVLFYVMMLRAFKAHPFVAFIAAAFYMLNPEFISHVYPGHSGKMMVIAWLPFVVWRLKALMDAPGFLNSSLLGLGISICLFTSHTQMTYFMLWGLFFYWVVALAFEWFSHRDVKRLALPSVYFWCAIVLGIVLSFIQFYPSFQFIRDAYSVRGVERGFEYAASWSLHWPEFFSLWVPEFGNYLQYYWSANPFKLNTEYAGAIVCLLAVFAVAYKPSPWRIFWAALGVFAVLYSMGAHTPVFHIAYYIVPGVKKFRACSMIMFWFSFIVALLAGLFLNDVLKGGMENMDERRKKRWRNGLAAAMGAITLIALIFSAKGFVASIMQGVIADPQKGRIFEANFSEKFVPALWIWWCLAMATAALVWAVMLQKVSGWALCLAVFFLGLFDAMRIDRDFITVVNPRRYIAKDPALTQLRDRMQEAPFRCFFLPGVFAQNAEGIYGLEGIGDFHDNELQWYREFRGDQQNSNYFTHLLAQDERGGQFLDVSALHRGNNFLNLANMRYYVTRQRGSIVTVENEGALDRISFIPRCVVMPEREIAQALKENAYDIRTTVALLEEPSEKPVPSHSDDTTAVGLTGVKWEKYTVNYRKVRVNVPRDGFLRISEVYYPGWEILIDGKKARIYRADLAWMAVYAAKGEHTVEMMPKSLYLAKASMVSFPAIAIMTAYWIGIAVLKLRRKKINE